MTYFARADTGTDGFGVVAGRAHGLRRIVLAAGRLDSGAGGPLHLHHGEEILLVRSGTVDVTVAGEQRRCGPGDVVVVPTDTVHGFTTVTETTMDVVAELDAGQLFPVTAADGSRQLIEVYRADMPWGRRPPAGFDWTSDEEMAAILARVAE